MGDPYVYESESGHGGVTFIATCPRHCRDLSIHWNRSVASRVAEAHARIFHPRTIDLGVVKDLLRTGQ